MHRLNSDGIFKILPLFDFELPNQTALLSCANGDVPGEFFVDDITNPTACLAVIGFYNWTFVGGSPKQGWLNRAFSILRTNKYLTLIWSEWATTDFRPPPEFTESINRYEFLDLTPSFSSEDRRFALNKDLKIRRMNRELFSRCQWHDEMTLAYGSPQGFLDLGLGFCLMRGEDIYCEVYALFKARQRYEMGVITADAYRGLGFGYKTCSFILNACAEAGCQTSWSCHQDNIGSTELARKLGYQIERKYQMLYYPLKSN